MRKLLFFGPISPPISGPGVKNKLMIEWLFSRQGKYKMVVLNAFDFRRLKLMLMLKGLYNFLFVKRVLLSVSKNGRLAIVPICYIFGKKVLLFPAGGSFDEEINDLSPLVKRLFLHCCKCVTSTYVQTTSLQNKLQALGLKNVVYFPNPRENRGFKAKIEIENNRFSIVFLSKIREGKGPLLLVEAIKKLTIMHPTIEIELNFYGIVDEDFKNEFFKAINENTNIHYRGVAASENVQATIAENNLFVLPTSFPEGVPGAVIEAMFTGIPIVVSNFTAASELINSDVDGKIIPQNDLESLVNAMSDLISDKSKRLQYSLAINESAKRFDFNDMMSSFVAGLGKDNY